jgi:peptide/nickel transport system permease protein
MDKALSPFKCSPFKKEEDSFKHSLGTSTYCTSTCHFNLQFFISSHAIYHNQFISKNSFFIVLLASIFSIILAPLSILKTGGGIDRIIGYFTSIGLSIPGFIVGIVLTLIFSLRLQWLPSIGYVPFAESPGENLQLMILPSVTGALTATPFLVKYLRASMLEIKQSSYIRTAEGKGLSNSHIMFRHILPNSLVPTLTMLGLIVGYTLSGVIVIEYMFGLPGIGSLAIESAFKRDYAIIQAVALTIIGLFILTTLLFDIACGLVDPRLRLSKERQLEV